ncbi:hypothetical protein F5Y05DRAFT_413273 [Hypoxylon sp. FL0543]|nr:hypothetical protein F5Y05DRAFT_413273 [Hypoxylon sp. FL0543]
MDASPYAGMSDEDATLAIRLMQEDAQDALSTTIGKGKQPQGTETDEQVALNLFLAELQTAETSFDDRRMARSILEAVQADGQAISQCQQEEQVARTDRDMSLSLSRGENTPAAPDASQANPSAGPDNEYIEKLSCIFNTGINQFEKDDDTNGYYDVLNQPESSSRAASRRSRRTKPCEACRDEKHFAELARAPCQHEYCGKCLTQIFQNATNDESLFPPRCCKQPIPLNQSLAFLAAGVVQEFRQKALEYSTPRRTYCHSNRCNVFILPTNYANDIATCNKCGSRTCMLCKGASHIGDCPNDERLQQVLQLAQEQHWQRCQNCWALVELIVGCNHMTCRCGHQFCYVCGAQWKSCECEHWEEARLVERAVQIDARDHGVRDDPVVEEPVVEEPVVEEHVVEEPVVEEPVVEEHVVEEPRPMNALPVRRPSDGVAPQQTDFARDEEQLRIQELMGDLQDNHECDHDHWISRKGHHACEECGDIMRYFIYECRQCHIMACRSCRFHRI